MAASIFDQLGINWQLLLSQAVNFFILLLVLRFFVYKPLLTVMRKRSEKISQGLEKAEQADIRLREVDGIAKNMLKKADQDSVAMIKDTQEKAKLLEQSLQKKAEDHQKAMMAQIALEHKKQQEEAKNLVYKQAMELVKKTIIKTVELNPKAIDEALIEKAVSQLKEN